MRNLRKAGNGSCLAIAILSLCIGYALNVATAGAATVTYAVVGEVTNVGDFDFVAPALDPDLLKIPEIGDPMAATFKFDPDAIQTGLAFGVATYGEALLEVSFSLPESGIVFTADSVPVTTQNDAIIFGQGVTDVWQTEVLDGTGVSLFTLPISDGFPAPDAIPSTVSMRLEDIGTPNIFASSPAPLVTPADSSWIPERTFEFGWDDLFGLSPFVQGEITSITIVPEPNSLAVLIAGLALNSLSRRRRDAD